MRISSRGGKAYSKVWGYGVIRACPNELCPYSHHPLGAEKVTPCIVWSGRIIYSWDTPNLADAVEDNVFEFLLVVLPKMSAHGVCDCVLEAWQIDC